VEKTKNETQKGQKKEKITLKDNKRGGIEDQGSDT
jgi:hypothetical protein